MLVFSTDLVTQDDPVATRLSRSLFAPNAINHGVIHPVSITSALVNAGVRVLRFVQGVHKNAEVKRVSV